MKFKTKSRICTGIVTLALVLVFIYSNAYAASEMKTVQCGDSDLAKITATIGLGDKDVVEKGKYLYTYCATLSGPYCDAATNAKVVISGAKSVTLKFSKSKKVFPAVSQTSKTNWIKAEASMNGYNPKSVTITK